MTVLTVVAVLASVPVTLASLYLLTLTMGWRRPQPRAAAAPLRFCVLVPAHNEALGIGRTIRSLQSVRYARDHVRIVVMADNCTDATAAIARAHGAEVLERHDTGRRGKGWALHAAIQSLLGEPNLTREAWDVLVVVDADTQVEANLLDVVARHVNAGDAAVQVAYRPRPAGVSPTSVITDVAFSAFHLVRSGARERWGLSCGLRGNGMAFTRQVLRDVPHTAFTRTEDLEFGILLGLHGVRVAFAGDTTVFGDMPETAAVVTQQRERWIGGRLALARRFALRLLRESVSRRRLMLADLAIDLLIPPVSALVVIAAVGLGIVVSGWALGVMPVGVVLVWMMAAAALSVHVWHAAWVIGRTRALLGALAAVPAYALGKTRIAGHGLRATADVWVRTTREGELS
jgi:cellulose synthase/poly-beta-1,6-N-acetylglucosamine synthase-like glycosyltransferase